MKGEFNISNQDEFDQKFDEIVYGLIIELIDEWENELIINKNIAKRLRSYEELKSKTQEWLKHGFIDDLTAKKIVSYESSKFISKENV